MIPNDTRPGPPGSEMLICPVNGCPWRYERPKPGAIVAPLTGPCSSIEDIVREAYTAEVRQTDAVVRAHLDTHSVEDYLTTISELRAQLAAANPFRATMPAGGYAVVKGKPYRMPPREPLTPGPDGAVRDADGKVLLYVTRPAADRPDLHRPAPAATLASRPDLGGGGDHPE